MTIRSLVIGAMLLTATPVFAQSQAAKNDPMWNVFLKLYPQRAPKAHEEGAVGFLVTLNNKGDVTNCQVTQSSGHPILDEETCKLITLNAVFKPDPNLSPSQTKTSPGVITWKLPDSTTQLAAPQAVSSNGAPEKIVCKKTAKAGTLSGFERTCMTPTEWAKQSDDMKQLYEEIQGKKGSTSGN